MKEPFWTVFALISPLQDHVKIQDEPGCWDTMAHVAAIDAVWSNEGQEIYNFFLQWCELRAEKYFGKVVTFGSHYYKLALPCSDWDVCFKVDPARLHKDEFKSMLYETMV